MCLGCRLMMGLQKRPLHLLRAFLTQYQRFFVLHQVIKPYPFEDPWNTSQRDTLKKHVLIV